MQPNSPILYIEINKTEYIFAVGLNDEENHFKLIHKESTPIQGITNNKITDFELVHDTLKKNIYLIEQKINFTFKETILIINNFDYSIVNLTGYKKLNGSQLLKENITYILNSLKANINEFEKNKTILHIFNSKYCLDKKNIENLPVGLFGDFYSQELSFSLINNNDYKNLNNIFSKFNIRIKKIFLKGFLEGAYLIGEKKNLDSFFKIEINTSDSQLIFFDNASLKFVENFQFGSDLILNDISKIISLKKETIKKIISNSILKKIISEEEFLEKEYFKNENFRKIKKKLIHDIALARIQEVAELILLKNINVRSFLKEQIPIYLNISDEANFRCFRESYEFSFSSEKKLIVNYQENITFENTLNDARKIAYFGWKKEAVPIINAKKSLIARFFEALFN